jgi:hypothetical protein
VRAQGHQIFCLPYPATEPYVSPKKLPQVPFERLDKEYKEQVEVIRMYLQRNRPGVCCVCVYNCSLSTPTQAYTSIKITYTPSSFPSTNLRHKHITTSFSST